MSEAKGFSERENKILKVLFNAIRPLSTKEVSAMSGFAWETVASTLKKLASRKYVIKEVYKASDNREFASWRFNYELKQELKQRLIKGIYR